MASFKGIARNFLSAFLAPFSILVVSFVILIATSPDKNPEKVIRLYIDYPWRMLFAIGILSSIWVQFTLEFYYADKDYKESTKLHYRKVTEYIQLFMLGSIIVALICIQYYYIHILATLFYLLLVSTCDTLVWLSSEALAGEKSEQKHQKFKECCRQLLFHVDGVVFFVVLFWVLIISFSLSGERASFILSSELIEPSKGAVGNLVKHELREPLMAGMIGFHAILSVILLLVHLMEWESSTIAGSGSE